MSVIRNILKLFASVPPPPAATTTTLPPEVPPDVPYVRFAEESDLRGLLRVERSTRQAEYWNASDFRTALRHPKIRLVLVELNGRVIGYVAVEVRSRHLAIRALAVHKDSQRKFEMNEFFRSNRFLIKTSKCCVRSNRISIDFPDDIGEFFPCASDQGSELRLMLPFCPNHTRALPFRCIGNLL
jgi:hypothetical protein